jgi:hypothetical protein
MTHTERVSAIASLGFTDRQADFLVQVMLHAGVCLGRQYCAFAGIRRGQKMVDFLGKLVDKRYATPYPCGHSRARIFHVHHVALYDAIGQRHARFRKRTAVAHAVERLMILDHVLAHRDVTWLGAEEDKLAHFLTTTSLRREELPRLAFGHGADVTIRFFPDKLPIGVSSDRRSHTVLYLLTDAGSSDFRVFLRRHAELLRALPTWTIRLLVPTGIKVEVVEAYQRGFREELATPLHPTVASELRWFYQTSEVTSTVERARLWRARRAFGAPRFRALRRAWQMDGERVVDVAMSTALSDAIAREAGRLECHHLARQYFHLSPLVGTA